LRDGRMAVVLRGGATHVGITGRLDMAVHDFAARNLNQ